MAYALYMQYGSELLRIEVSKTKIIPNKFLQNFVILSAEKKHFFLDTLPRNKEYLDYNGISIIENTINGDLWK